MSDTNSISSNAPTDKCSPTIAPTQDLKSKHKKETLDTLVSTSKNQKVSNNSTHSNTNSSQNTVNGIHLDTLVIKNINFNVSRENFLEVMNQMGLPAPYAFNYHCERNLFRGIAFANYRTQQDALKVKTSLNGISLFGRELTVEYKKVPSSSNNAAKSVSQNQSTSNKPFYQSPRNVTSRISPISTTLPQHTPIPRTNMPNSRTNPNSRPKTFYEYPTSSSLYNSQPPYAPNNTTQSNPADRFIDLNDSDTRLLYDVISKFKRDKTVAELDFPSALNTIQRQTVMLIAERFGLNHETRGFGSSRSIRLYKNLETLLEATEAKHLLSTQQTSFSLSNNRFSQYLTYNNPLSEFLTADSINSLSPQTNRSRSSTLASQASKKFHISLASTNKPVEEVGGTNLDKRRSLYSIPSAQNHINDSFSKMTGHKQHNSFSEPHFDSLESPKSPSNTDAIIQRKLQLLVLDEKRARRVSDSRNHNFDFKLVPSSKKQISIVDPQSTIQKFPEEPISPQPTIDQNSAQVSHSENSIQKA